MFALVLTGAPGAGKTSVLEALTDALTAEDMRHATVEVEAITSAHPPLGNDQWTMPVEAICGLYRRFGYDLLLVTATVELDELVAAAARLSLAIARLDGIALALSTEARRPADVAAQIRDAFPGELRPDRG